MEGAPQRAFRLGHSLAVFGVFLSLLTLTFSAVNAPRTIAFGTSEVATLSNQYRANAGLPNLVISGTLTSSAQAKANHMAANSYFAHDAPDGTSPWYFIDQAGYAYSTAGENLALTNQTASSVADGWYNSPGHRANMLSADFTEVGYGIAFVPTFTYNSVTYANVYLVAAHYAKPISAPAPPAQTPVTPAPQPSVSPTVQPISSQSNNNSPENTSPTAEPTTEPVPESEEDADEQDSNHPPVSGSTDDNGNTTSGTLATANTSQPKLSMPLAYGGLGLGSSFVVAGTVIETRRLMRHLPLIPHRR